MLQNLKYQTRNFAFVALLVTQFNYLLPLFYTNKKNPTFNS